ncbi:hypothetical protein HPB48_021581 [Haemaphysalis longicornis]|uniref:Uncharacterized protein n=1 Tax=Haemaphysalis longicornis TaxID=44386 RepID=A0A9J6GXY5_HAELO|nr:hypothetical protein HPB48_021581 [Haemaphysalis longicornis]
MCSTSSSAVTRFPSGYVQSRVTWDQQIEECGENLGFQATEIPQQCVPYHIHVLDGKELFSPLMQHMFLKNLRGQLLSSEEFTLSEATVLDTNSRHRKSKLEHIKAVVDFDAERNLSSPCLIEGSCEQMATSQK